MFATHQPIISAWARQSPENLARVMQFVIVTARNPFHRVPADLQACDRPEEARSVLFGWKYDAFMSAWLGRDKHFAALERVTAPGYGPRYALAQQLEYLCLQPGFGPVKAGFVTQLVYGTGGCMDTHNMKLYGINPHAFDGIKNKGPKGRRKTIQHYISVLGRAGSAGVLWDKWCEHMAAIYPQHYRHADHVSALHCTALGLQES